MTWTPSGQVATIIATSPHSRTMTHKNRAGATLGTFTALFMHTQPDEAPLCIAPRSATAAKAVDTGETLTATGFDAYVVEGVRSDGAHILEFELRHHIRPS